jgi:hypothetical protein
VKQPESVESQLLGLCSRTTPSNEQSARIRQMCTGAVRWDALLRAAERHAVLPLVGRNLETAVDNLLPHEVKTEIAQKKRARTFQSMRLCAELAKIVNAFTEDSIRVLSFKGPTLAALAYEQIALRPFGDIDILVSPDDAVRAARLLHRLGFPAWSESDEQNLAGECESTFIRPRDNLCVDLHWALSRDGLPFNIPFDTLWNQAQRVPIGGAEVATLPMDDLCLFLCLHGTKHLWERLSWVCDIAELVRAQPQLDLERLLKRADSIGHGRMFLLAMELARSILALPLPAAIASRASSDRVVQRMAAQLGTQLLAIDHVSVATSPLRDAIRMMACHLRILNRARDRIRYLKYAATPNPRDRNSLTLPPALSFLHLISRPVRLFRRYAMKSTAS